MSEKKKLSSHCKQLHYFYLKNHYRIGTFPSTGSLLNQLTCEVLMYRGRSVSGTNILQLSG